MKYRCFHHRCRPLRRHLVVPYASLVVGSMIASFEAWEYESVVAGCDSGEVVSIQTSYRRRHCLAARLGRFPSPSVLGDACDVAVRLHESSPGIHLYVSSCLLLHPVTGLLLCPAAGLSYAEVAHDSPILLASEALEGWRFLTKYLVQWEAWRYQVVCFDCSCRALQTKR